MDDPLKEEGFEGIRLHVAWWTDGDVRVNGAGISYVEIFSSENGHGLQVDACVNDEAARAMCRKISDAVREYVRFYKTVEEL